MNLLGKIAERQSKGQTNFEVPVVTDDFHSTEG